MTCKRQVIYFQIKAEIDEQKLFNILRKFHLQYTTTNINVCLILRVFQYQTADQCPVA